MRTRIPLATVLLAAAAVAVPAAPASAAFCINTPVGCVAPCDVNNVVGDALVEATNGQYDVPRCLN